MNVLKVIADRAAQMELPFLIVGGHAVIRHGYDRVTFDLDLAVRRSEREAWLGLMKEIGYEFLDAGSAFLQFNPPPGPSAPVDLLLTNDATFQKFVSEGVKGMEEGTPVLVMSVQHLIALKCHAIKHGHPGRIIKDADDLIHLFLANRLDIEDGHWRELVLKYGPADLYEKLRHACKS